MANITRYETKHGQRWRVRYRKPDGTQTDKRGFQRKADAERWAAENVTTAIASGTYIDPTGGGVTVGAIYDAWLATRIPLVKRSTVETDMRVWRTHVAPKWSGRRIGGITRMEVQAWVSGIASRRSASTTIKAYQLFKTLMDMAVADRLIPRSPADGVSTPRRARTKRRRYLTVAELLRLADAAGHARLVPDQRRAIVLVLGFCGLRWGEMCGLRVSDIDFDRMRIHVGDNITGRNGNRYVTTPKNWEVRDVPMPHVVADALRGVVDGLVLDERVFRDPSGRPPRMQSGSGQAGNKTWWPTALRRAGLPLMSPHDLRHTAASIAVSAGANVKVLQRMLGHKSAAMTLDVYADLFDGDLDDVAERIDRACEECGQDVGTMM